MTGNPSESKPNDFILLRKVGETFEKAMYDKRGEQILMNNQPVNLTIKLNCICLNFQSGLLTDFY